MCIHITYRLASMCIYTRNIYKNKIDVHIYIVIYICIYEFISPGGPSSNAAWDDRMPASGAVENQYVASLALQRHRQQYSKIIHIYISM